MLSSKVESSSAIVTFGSSGSVLACLEGVPASDWSAGGLPDISALCGSASASESDDSDDDDDDDDDDDKDASESGAEGGTDSATVAGNGGATGT